jgi:signal transduction histidine kinase
MKRLGLAAALLLVLPVATAQQPGSGVLESTYAIEAAIPVAAMEELYRSDEATQLPDGTTLPESCGSGLFTRNQTQNWFRFRELPSQNGCGQMRYTFDLPLGATQVIVRFRADRSIQQSSSVGLPVDMVQELRIYDANGSTSARFAYYDAAAPQSLELRDFTYPVVLDPGQRSLTLGWAFFDRGVGVGREVINPVAGQMFSATVTQARLEMAGIPLVPQSIAQQRLGLQDDAVRHSTTVAVTVPETLGVSGRISVTLRVDDALVFSHAVGPRGEPIEDDLIDLGESGDVRTVILAGAATERHGAGTYRLTFLSSSPISPSPLLYPFVAAVLAVPVGAGLVALRSTRQFRRQATPEFAATATNLEHVVLVMLAVYVLLPLGVLFTRRLPLLASWPLEGEAGLVYLLIGLAFVAFLAVGVVGRRHLRTLMLEEVSLQEKARRELERSNRELEEFAYVASHDLQEPLRTVASYTQLLQRRYKGQLDAQADEFIDSAVEGAQRMQALIQDLLAYSRVGSKPEEASDVDLNAVVTDVRRLLRQALEESGGEVVTTGLPTVVGRERQFTQLLQNLIGNALKFRHPDRKPRVEVVAERLPTAWRITVRDNGIGFDPKHADRIFQIFQRLHGRDQYAGTGIGLAICKRIVELNGGRIGAESVEGQGSTFWFTVPDSK